MIVIITHGGSHVVRRGLRGGLLQAGRAALPGAGDPHVLLVFCYYYDSYC